MEPGDSHRPLPPSPRRLHGTTTGHLATTAAGVLPPSCSGVAAAILPPSAPAAALPQPSSCSTQMGMTTGAEADGGARRPGTMGRGGGWEEVLPNRDTPRASSEVIEGRGCAEATKTAKTSGSRSSRRRGRGRRFTALRLDSFVGEKDNDVAELVEAAGGSSSVRRAGAARR